MHSLAWQCGTKSSFFDSQLGSNFVLWCCEEIKVFVICVRLQRKLYSFRKLILEKKSIFWNMENHLSYNISIWKKAYHKNFIHFPALKELYPKKLFIYGSCIEILVYPVKVEKNLAEFIL